MSGLLCKIFVYSSPPPYIVVVGRGNYLWYISCFPSSQHVAVNNFLWQLYVMRNNKMYLGFHVNCPVFMSNFNQIQILSTESHESPQY